MKENNKGSMIILTVIGIATLLIAVIGATFAFFTVQIKGNVEESTVQISSSTMLVTFDTKNKLEYTGAYPGRPETDYEKFSDNKLRFSLTSDLGLGSTTKYDVYLVIDKSEFVKNPLDNNSTDELVYVASQIPERIISDAANTNNTRGNDGVANYTNKVNNVEYNPETLTIEKKDSITGEKTTETVTVGLIPSNITYAEDTKEEDKVRIKVGSGELGSHGSVDNWQLEVWLKETDEQQNYNQGKTLNAHVDIVVTDSIVSHEEVSKTTP